MNVAEDGGRIVAFVSVGPSRDDDAEGELYAIYALPEAWGTGAGAALMQAGLAAMRAAGYRDAVLYVLDDNPRARRFYEREGWGSTAERRARSSSTSRSPRFGTAWCSRLRLGDRDGRRGRGSAPRPRRSPATTIASAPKVRSASSSRARVVGADLAAHREPGRERRRVSESAVCSASARRSSTAPVGASSFDASAGTVTTISVASRGPTDAPTTSRASRRRGRGAARGVDESTLSRAPVPGSGSCMSHQTMPATTTTAAATPSQVLRYAPPTITSAPTIDDEEEPKRLRLAAERVAHQRM